MTETPPSPSPRFPRAPAVGAVLFIALTIVAALWARWSRSSYDPAVALLGLQTVALAWYTYVTHQAVATTQRIADGQQKREHEAKGEAAQRSATAILAELAILTLRVRPLVEQPWANPGTLDHPVLTAALTQVPPFDRQTIARLVTATWYVEALSNAHGRAAQLDDDLDETAGNLRPTMTLQGKRGEARDAVKVRARWAYNEMQQLGEDLLREGGQHPAAPPDQWLEGTPLPNELPDIFPRAKVLGEQSSGVT